MENRKRNVQIIIRVTEEERALIEEKMQQIPTLNLSAYARKILIDGYIITLDLQEVKGHTAQLQKIGVATHFSCPIITLVVCHRINRYNDMGTEKGKGFRTLIFCTELSPETITKTMVIISKYEVEYKETEDIFNLSGFNSPQLAA